MAHEAAHHAHDDHGHDGHGHHDTHHYDYVKIWGILVVLLIVSVIGPELGIKWVTLVTAFGIAFVKAGMVIRYFMHAGSLPAIVHYFLVTALVFMLLFFAGVSPDVMNHEGTRWVNDAARAETERVLAIQAAGGDGIDHGHGGAHGAPAGHEAPAHGGGH